MNIVVAFEGSAGAEAALEAARRVVHEAGGRLMLLQMLNMSTDAADVFAESQQAALEIVVGEAQQQLDERAARIEGVDAEGHVEVLIRGEDVATGLVRFVRESGADILAIGSSRAGGLRGALLGSVAGAVAQHSDVPVLLVRA